jgi:hypothetical protein
MWTLMQMNDAIAGAIRAIARACKLPPSELEGHNKHWDTGTAIDATGKENYGAGIFRADDNFGRLIDGDCGALQAIIKWWR